MFRNHHRRVVTATALFIVPACAILGVTANAQGVQTGRDVSPPPASVLGHAADGGAVIVVLRNQLQTPGLAALSAARRTAAAASQAPLLADIRTHGGTDVVSLVSLNAIAAHLSAAEVERLRNNPAVAVIEPDVHVPLLGREQPGVGSPAAKVALPDRTHISPKICPKDPKQPFLEPEALTVDRVQIHGGGADQSLKVTNGRGIIVAIDGMNELAGNPNFIRRNGTHVVIDAPNEDEDDSDGEYYGDASSVAAQGTVVYDYSKELPYSGLPKGCTFIIRGVAPGASLVDTTNIERTRAEIARPYRTESEIIAGIDYDVLDVHADILSESYGYTQVPGQYRQFYAANDAAVKAGTTVVVSSGDSGVSGTISSPATDPLVIAAGGTNTLRLESQAYGYDSWVDNNITPLSSGGTAPNNRMPDLVAPGYSGEAACSPQGSDCPEDTQTEAFGGTSESCPLIAGAAADVIRAYMDTHDGKKPTPAVVKEILVSTAQDVDSPSDQQGGGLLDVYAAVRAAQRYHEGSGKPSDVASIVAAPSQVVVAGDGGGTTKTTVRLTNTGASTTTVTGNYRWLGDPEQIGTTVTENVTAPPAGRPLPPDGGRAAAPIHFTVPKGLDRMSADMIWPDPTNANVLSYTLTDPRGRLVQISYDYGTGGRVSNIQHVEVADPTPGKWTASIKWANGRAHLQEPPNTPGSYRGKLQFRVMGQHFETAPATKKITIPAQSTVKVPLTISYPKAPGDHPESVQFTGSNGESLSLAVARRTLIPSEGGKFDTLITSSVGRGVGQITTFNVDVPAGEPGIKITFHAPDTHPDNPLSYYLLNPEGQVVVKVTTPNGDGGGKAVINYPKPEKGRWEIDVMLNLTTSGHEFTQLIPGVLTYQK